MRPSRCSGIAANPVEVKAGTLRVRDVTQSATPTEPVKVILDATLKRV